MFEIVSAAVFIFFTVLIMLTIVFYTHWGFVAFVTLMGVITARNMSSIAWNKGSIETYDKISDRRQVTN